ncbi:MAG TPA: hypothetical protein VEX43_17160 [Chthoniobacterales bacterium]|nr:hypothetical protein [Chthoniobacterales bacterium]
MNQSGSSAKEIKQPGDSTVPGWALWMALVAILVLCHIKFFFLEGHAEPGDYAANALQIRNAKYFHELYGNYSRWGFHHPGPAFFYAYAAGEWLFYDLTRLVPSPFNAHILTGIIVQCGFFAWALCIVRRTVSHPLLIPLLLVFGGLHFATVNSVIRDSVFTSIWAPHVLLFPFLCFLIACASLASGDAKALVAATVAGSFLVHGHVAQPLFVVPCFLLAIAVLLGRSRRSNGSFAAAIRLHKRPILISGGIVVLALVPLVIDATRGRQSNLNLILQHFSGHSGDRKTLPASLIYLATFFSYVANPETFCDQITGGSLRFLRDRWHFVAAWVAIALGLLGFGWRAFRRNRFAAWLGIYFILSTGLTVCWGVMQNGPMFNFNGFFNFGLIFILLILVAAVLCDAIPVKASRTASIGLGILGLLLFVPVTRGWRLAAEMPSVSYPPTLSSGLASATQADGARTKFLVFPHGDWPQAVGVALALERLGYNYAITPEWAFMFGRDHARPLAEAVNEDDLAVWKFTTPAPSLSGVTLNEGTFISTFGVTLDPAGAEVRFAGPEANAAQYVVAGWDLAEDKAGQMTEDLGVLQFRRVQTTHDVECSIWFRSDDSAPALEPPALSVRLNRLELARVQGDTGSKLTFRIPRESWNRSGLARLLLTRPKDQAPFRVERIVFGPAAN